MNSQSAAELPKARAARVWQGMCIATAVALLNYAAWAWWTLPQQAPEVTVPVHGLSYAPFGRADSPRSPPAAREALIERDMRIIAGVTRQIRTYSAAQAPTLAASAARHGLKVTQGLWLSRDADNNAREMVALAALVGSPGGDAGTVTRVIAGNETVLNKVFTPAELIARLRAVKRVTTLPVSTAEPWHVWIKHPELADEVDFITVHILPYWEGLSIDTAVDESLERLGRVLARFPGKPVVIGEIGYPSQGDTIAKARPSPAVQARFVREFAVRAAQYNLDYFFVEAFDQPWKLHEEGRSGGYWGMFNAAREPKFRLTGLVSPDPYWRYNAVTASLAGFVFVLWFLAWTRALRTSARIAFGVMAQVVMSVLVVVLTLPFIHYMWLSDWLVWALLIPTSLVMAAILLTHLFEFAELYWEGSLRRRFAPKKLPEGARQPRVSIHLACCNEPPDMVLATLESLTTLDYANYEVIVVDNNTSDPAFWQPVKAWCEALPPPMRGRFRFFHLERWPGYKAGALNFALVQTDPHAEIVAVVDADYVVKPNWLLDLVAHFEDPKVALVQAPQAHRDWGSTRLRQMMNWEYEGFFRIGMHHRNERDAIIQHGTMTMIRASTLRAYGQWSEWCMCEDAELGLRLMRQGLRTVYVDEVMGEGLTPDTFASFKRQRMRWAAGGMQIFKAHARALLAAPRVSGLTIGQRYHFLAGWLPWIGDALHLVFVIAALFWTLGMLVLPYWFSAPIALYMLPLGVFCAVKLVTGPLLYVQRVRCGAADISGAALAGMALVHAIGRGILQGLTTRQGAFVVTAKGGAAGSGALTRALASVREEGLLFTGLLIAMAALAVSRKALSREDALWICMLALQALPYLAALLCAVTCAWPGRRQRLEQRRHSAHAAMPVAHPVGRPQ